MKSDFSKVKYENRDCVEAGDTYGIGQPPKVGKMRSSFMDAVPQKSKKTVGKPPRKV